MKTTLIIAVYNHSEFLRRCLLSTSAFDSSLHEIVVTDDGSSEDTLAVVKESAALFNCRLTFVQQQDIGFRLARSKNNGIRHATGDYLIFIDQDLIFTRGYLPAFVNHRKRGQFVVSYPIRLTEEQSSKLDEATIKNANFDALTTPAQRTKIKRQYIKDNWEHYVRKFFRTDGTKPKLRGGCFAAFRDDLLMVNGFDENFQGWGNEDDDLGRRLYRAGIVGKNVFWNEYPLHIYHPENSDGGARPNRDYNRMRIQAIKNGEFRALNGVENTLGDDKAKVISIQN